MAQAKASRTKRAETRRELATRWGEHSCFFREGWVGVPVSFLCRYGSPKMPASGLTASEAMFVLQLMAFKWDNRDPFPSYHTLAERMGITDKQVRRYAQSIEKKGLLERTARIGSSNNFDLSKLFNALHALLKAERQQAKKVVSLPKKKVVVA